jgi:hypothetical protein
VSAAPAGKITRDDIESKLRQIHGDVDTAGESFKPSTLMVGAAVVAVVLVAYLIGKRRGKRKSTIVEIRRM